MRILIDYRPALRERTGVGEYMHHLISALTRLPASAADEISVFTSSWKDRPAANLAAELGARVVDLRIPVRVLNALWHRLEWPSVEMLGVSPDVVHAAHPLLMPARHAAQIVTIHDLFFLAAPESTRAEIRRDYAALAPRHARRADAIVVNSRYTGALVRKAFGVRDEAVHVCPPGPPVWSSLGREPHVPPDGYVLFIGTLEKRKNLGVLLDAYSRLLEHHRDMPPLVVAGRMTADGEAWLHRLSQAPLAGHSRYLGYVADKEQTYAGARLVVVPSLDEGFGIPVLEAMAAGIPVVAADRGALPEVLGDAGMLVDADRAEPLAAAIHRMVTDREFAVACAARGLARARQFSWTWSAAALRGAYEAAVENRRRR